jgi:uncharacterized protein YeeX (DUF496 family)
MTGINKQLNEDLETCKQQLETSNALNKELQIVFQTLRADFEDQVNYFTAKEQEVFKIKSEVEERNEQLR